jgi:conjugal transfer pilus assembly protein TraW
MQFFNLLFLSLIMASDIARAHVIGPVYPIVEENAIEVILRKLHRKAASGELKALQREIKNRALHSLIHLKPHYLPKVLHYSKWLIDPSVHYTKALKTPDGKVIITPNTRINPLNYITLSKELVFFDGRDQAQCQFVKKLLSSRRIKPILTAGSWLDLTKDLKTQVYFDQQGELIKRFGIRATPSIVRQQNQYLLLEEIPVT